MRLILSEGRAEVRMPRYTFSRGVITYLKVRNLAIVEELAIEPGPGLNVLTGETGAGKSLLIDSLEFLRGARGSTEMIRAGSDRMTAEAVFHLPKKLRAQLDETMRVQDAVADGNATVTINGRTRHVISYLEDFLFEPGRARTPPTMASPSRA